MREPVVVVGAGPTGLTVALLLARHGVPTVVLERHTRPYALPRAVHLDDEGLRVLQQAGVVDDVLPLTRAATGLRLLDAQLRPFAVFRRGTGPAAHGFPAANLFDQPDLERVLLAAAAREPLVQVRRGVEVTGVRQGVDAAEVAVRGGTGIPAAAVLGCDGEHSLVRTAIGARLRDLRYSQRWLVVDALVPEGAPRPGGVDQVCDPSRAATFMHIRDDRFRWELRLHPGESAEVLGRRDELAHLLRPWLADVPAAGWDLVRCAEYTFHARLADRWRHGRVFLLGDAAHLTPPFIGQGLGAGLRDAHNLAWKLAAAWHDTAWQGAGTSDALLDSYRAERAPHAEAVVRAAVRVGRVMTGGGGAGAVLRRPAAAAVLRLPGAERRALAGVRARFPPGPWVARRTHHRHLAGTVVPQPTVRTVAGRVRLDVVLGTGWALVHAGRADDALRARAQALGAVVVRLGDRPAGDHAGATVVSAELASWLRRGRTGAVLVRPDRVVAAVGPSPGPPPPWHDVIGSAAARFRRRRTSVEQDGGR